MASQLINMKKTPIKKTILTNPPHFESINKMTKKDVLSIVEQLSKPEQEKLYAHVEKKHPKNENSAFFVMRAYIYNNYLKPQDDEDEELVSSPHEKPQELSCREYLKRLLNK